MIKGINRMIKGMFIKIKDAILDLPKNQLPNLEFLLPTFMALTAFISGLVGYIKFVIKGGYKQAADKQLEGLFKNMTTGIREKIFTGTIDKILIGLLILEFIVIIIYYFKTSGKGKRIVMIVDSVILGAIYVWLSAGGSNEGRYKVYDSETGKDIGDVDFRRKE